MTPKIEKEMSEAVQHVTGGKLDELPQAQLEYFATLMRGMSDLAEAELKRRGIYRFPIFHRP